MNKYKIYFGTKGFHTFENEAEVESDEKAQAIAEFCASKDYAYLQDLGLVPSPYALIQELFPGNCWLHLTPQEEKLLWNTYYARRAELLVAYIEKIS